MKTDKKTLLKDMKKLRHKLSKEFDVNHYQHAEIFTYFHLLNGEIKKSPNL